MFYLRIVTLLFITILIIIGYSTQQLRRDVVSPMQAHPSQIFRRQSRDAPTCGFHGNSDIYGFGIRLGIYFQWIASVISKAFATNPESVRDVMDVDAIFLLAIFIATALLSGGVIGPVYGVEILILLHIYFGDIFTIFFHSVALRTHSSSISVLGTWFRWTITTGMAAYATWYWFRGLDKMLETPCGGFAFIFAKVALNGKARIVFKILTIANLVYWGVDYIRYFFLFLVPVALIPTIMFPYYAVIWLMRLAGLGKRKNKTSRFDRKESLYHLRYWLGWLVVAWGTTIAEGESSPWQDDSEVKAGSSPEEKGPKEQTAQISRIHPIFKYFNVFVLLFSILAIELIIRWNNILDVYTIRSTGQIIPFIIGLGGLWKVVMSIGVRIIDDSVWSPNYEAFRTPNGTWARFKKVKPAKRRSIS